MMPKIRRDYSSEVLQNSGVDPFNATHITNELSFYVFMAFLLIALIFLTVCMFPGQHR